MNITYNTSMTTIALYDYKKDKANLGLFWNIMMDLSEKTSIPWGAMGITGRDKYMTFKGGFSRVVKKDLSGLEKEERLILMGGVDEPGTDSWWQICAGITKMDTRNPDISGYTTYISFPSVFDEEKIIDTKDLLKKLLNCAPFQYGIIFEMLYIYAPDAYTYGGVVHIRSKEYPRDGVKDSQIRKWSRVYKNLDGTYRTGLLRDVYPHNILVETHLGERVGHTTLGAWIQKDPARGTLEKITDTHYLWSIDPADIPPIQEALQDAGLLLCYKL